MKTIHHICVYSLLLMTAATSHADSLGRLFTTPQERALLDNENSIPPENRGTSGRSESKQIMFNGALISSTGKRNFWVNGKQQDNHNPEEPRVYLTQSKQVRVVTPYSSQHTVIKPGQVLNLESGQITESFMLENTRTDEDKKQPESAQ